MGVDIEDMNRTENDVTIDSRLIRVIYIDIGCEISSCAVPIIIGQKAKDLRRLIAWSASFSNLFGQKHSLGQCTMLVVNGEERGTMGLTGCQYGFVMNEALCSSYRDRAAAQGDLFPQVVPSLIPILAHVPEIVDNDWPDGILHHGRLALAKKVVAIVH